MNCIEFLVQDENGGVHAGKIISKEKGHKFTDGHKKEMESKLIAEGFTVLALKITLFQ